MNILCFSLTVDLNFPSIMPSLDQLMKLMPDERSLLESLYASGVFYQNKQCSKCGRGMKLYMHEARWRCTKNQCCQNASIRSGSFFAHSRLSCCKIMQLGYMWLNKLPATSIISMSGVSSATVTQFNQYSRQLVADSLEPEDCMIGGEGVIVELDESKLGKRKYHRGHAVEGVWVLGGIERTQEGKVFMEAVPDRSATTLLEVIRCRVRLGSIVFTDMWKGYDQISSALGMEHRVVNHSVEFVSEDGVHTNTIEATWCGLKLLIPRRNRTKDVDGHLWEYIWRKRHRHNIWNSFIDALREVAY